MKRILAVLIAVLMLVLAGCSSETKSSSAGALSVVDAKGNTLTSDGSEFKITKPGTYTVSGQMNEGQILVDCAAEGDVIIVLDGADISSSSKAPIYVKEADKTIIRLASGSENVITDNRAKSEDEPNAAIFSHDDLKILGEGSLTVNGNKNNGITGKDKLTIEGGTITVNSDNHGIRGKDRLKIENGVITVNAGTDGLRATNDTESDKGEVLVENGVITITAGDDAIYAYNMVNIENGTFIIDTDNNAVKAENSINITGGVFEITTDDKDFACGNTSVASSAIVTVNGETQTY